MLSVLIFFTILFLPGLCFLWLANLGWLTRKELRPGGSFWLAIPTSFGISVSFISLLGWIGFFFRWNFYTVRLLYLTIVTILVLLSLYKLWKKQILTTFKFKIPRLKDHKLGWELVTGLFLMLMLLLAIYGGTWYSHTADSLNHIAAVRSLVKFNNPLPMQIYWPVTVSGMDPTFGTWHLALAVFVSLSGMDVAIMWALATIIVAPLLAWTFVVLALEIIGAKPAAILAGMLYVFVDLSGDFRTIAYPNRMGQIILWLAIAFTLLSIRAFAEKDNRLGRVGLLLATIFAWASTAVHQQYGPVLLGITFPALALAFLYNWVLQSYKRPHKAQRENVSPQPILLVNLFVLIAVIFGFAVRALYTISDKYPLLGETTQALQTESTWSLVWSDILSWFEGWQSPIAIASLASLLVIIFVPRKSTGLFTILSSLILVPAFIVFASLFLGRGGLVLATFERLKLLTPAFLYIGWAWLIHLVLSNTIISLRGRSYSHYPQFALAAIVIILTTLTLSKHALKPSGGMVSTYTPNSEYGFSMTSSHRSSLLVTRKEAIQALSQIRDGERILAEMNVGYEMAGLTGKLFLGLPSQHVPLQEKQYNDETYQDTRDFVNGNLTNAEMVEVLLRQEVSYVYADQELHFGKGLWHRLPTIPVLNEVASGDDWRLYKVIPDRAQAYIALEKEIQNTADFAKKLELLNDLRGFFSEDEQYFEALAIELPVKKSLIAEFVSEGIYYQRPYAPGVTYDFLRELDHATILEGDPNFIYRTAFIINEQPRGVLFQHPDSKIAFPAYIPPNSTLDFAITLDPATWQIGKGDGVEFSIFIKTKDQNIPAFNEYIDPKNLSLDRKWLNYSLDLSALGDQQVEIILETKCGPQRDTRFDWAGWGELRIRPIVDYDLIRNWDSLSISGTPSTEVKKVTFAIGGEKRNTVFQHPGSKISARIRLPIKPELHFGLGIDPAVWNTGKSDGIQFKIYIVSLEEPEVKHLVFDRFIAANDQTEEQAWEDVVLDLEEFGGKAVDLIFETLPGPNNNSNFDWGGWSSPFITAGEE